MANPATICLVDPVDQLGVSPEQVESIAQLNKELVVELLVVLVMKQRVTKERVFENSVNKLAKAVKDVAKKEYLIQYPISRTDVTQALERLRTKGIVIVTSSWILKCLVDLADSEW